MGEKMAVADKPSSLPQFLRWLSILLLSSSTNALGLPHEKLVRAPPFLHVPEIGSPPLFATVFAAAIVATSLPCFALGSDLIARGTVTLPSDVVGPARDSSAALYVTARPDRADNGEHFAAGLRKPTVSLFSCAELMPNTTLIFQLLCINY